MELFCSRLLTALFNGGYQGLALTGLILAVLSSMRRASAATRHHICLVALLLVALLPAAHFARSTSPSTGGEDSSFAIDHAPPPSPSAIGFMNEAGVPASPPAYHNEIDMASPPLPRIAADSPGIPNRTNLEAPPLVEGVVAPWRVSPKASVLIMGVGAIIALGRLAALAYHLSAIVRLKRAGREPDHSILEQFQRILTELKVTRTPTLLIVPETVRPCATGFWRPAVLAPAHVLAGGANRAEPILRHELAHIARRDDWANLFQNLVAAIFFFHPAVWLLSRRLDAEREIACDDHVLAADPDRRRYALLLTEFASQSAVSRWPAALAAWGSKSQLRRRIDMILDQKRNASPHATRRSVGIVGIAALLAAIVAIGFGPRVALAQSEHPDEIGEPSSEAAASENIDSTPRPIIARGVVAAVSPRHAIVAPAALAVPSPSVAPLIASAGPEPLPPGEDGPRPPKARSAKINKNEATLERRMDRLEKMLEQLLARDGSPKNKETGLNFNWNDNEFGRMQKEIERAAKDAERVAMEMQKTHAQHWKDAGWPGGKHFKMQRQVLEAQRKNLERQLQSVEQRLDALEDEEEESEEQQKEQQKHQEKSEDAAEDSDQSKKVRK